MMVQLAERMRINSSGNVGIGTSSPDAKLSVNGVASFGDGTALLPSIANFGDLNTGMWFPAADTIAFSEGGAEAMRITSDGRLGIGTTTPTEKLSVDGSVIFNESGNNVDFRVEGDTDVNLLFVDASTNSVGIGTSSPAGKLHVVGSEVFFKNDAGNCTVSIGASDSGNSVINLGDPSDGDVGRILYEHANNSLQFKVNASELMRIVGTQVFINCTADPSASVPGVRLGNPAVALCAFSCGSPTTEVYQLGFYNGNGLVGRISTNGSATSYTTSSDYRLKENVNYNFDATTRLKQLKPARFNFIADADTTVDGFIAHEVQTVVPEAISGEKDETKTKEKVVVNANGNVIAENIEQADWQNGKIADDDGNTQYPTDSTWEATKVVPVYQGIDQAKLVPLLVKTIQELEARITALETTTP
jgi:hypothetical protein